MDIPQFPFSFPIIKMLAVPSFSFVCFYYYKNASVDIPVWISCCLCMGSLGYVPRSKTAGLYGIRIFNLIDVANIFAKVL